MEVPKDMDEQKLMRISRTPGVWETVMECPRCDGLGHAVGFYAVDYQNGCMPNERVGICSDCNGDGYVEIDDD